VNSPAAILAVNAASRFSSRMRSFCTSSSSTESGPLPFEEEHAITEEKDPICVVMEHGKQEEEEVVAVANLSPFMEVCFAWKRGVEIERGGVRRRAMWEAMDHTKCCLV